MPINKNSKLLMGLSMFWAFLIFALGVWWMYLLLILGEKLEVLSKDEDGPNILAMVKWEGGSFFILLLLLSATLFFLYLKDQKKTKSLQAFFASLTHELKTPLASIRLQAEVIRDTLDKTENSKLETLADRMIEDTSKLETEMDKILQLSRLERGGELNNQSIDLIQFLNNFANERNDDFTLTIQQDLTNSAILADEFALELILKNLIENTRSHTNSSQASIIVSSTALNSTILSYSDQGVFKGDESKLGSLFYKHNSKKGSGIGLYLVEKMMKAMNGQLSFELTRSFTLLLDFQKAKGEEE